jgi:hypothetical protein
MQCTSGQNYAKDNPVLYRLDYLVLPFLPIADHRPDELLRIKNASAAPALNSGDDRTC